MRQLRSFAFLFALLSSLLLIGCGGGGGGSGNSASPPPSSPPPQSTPPSRSDLLFGYFGTTDHADNALGPSSIVETAKHVNVIFEGGWGDASTPQGRQAINDAMAQHLILARSNGIDKAIITLDHLVYVGATPKRLREKRTKAALAGFEKSAAASGELRAFFQELQAYGVLDMIVAVYPIDEPDMAGVSDGTANAVNAEVRAVMNEFPALESAKIAVIYGDHGTPGMSSYDWVGSDRYGEGERALSWYDSLPPGKGKILVPGGANPWRNDPTAFYNKAESDPSVVAIIAFVWFDGGVWEGGTQKGIRSNGMAHAYCDIGWKVSHYGLTVEACP